MTDTKTVEVTIERLKDLPTGITVVANHTGKHATLVGPLEEVWLHYVTIGGVTFQAAGWTFDVDEDVLLPGEVVTDLSTLGEGDVVMLVRQSARVIGTLFARGDELAIASEGKVFTARGGFETLNKQVRLIERAPETITVRKDDVESALDAILSFEGLSHEVAERLREAIKE